MLPNGGKCAKGFGVEWGLGMKVRESNSIMIGAKSSDTVVVLQDGSYEVSHFMVFVIASAYGTDPAH